MFDFEKLKAFYRIGNDLSLSDISSIIQGAQKKSFRKGELLIRTGDTQKQVYFIKKGLLRIFLEKENGDDITFGLFPEFNVYINFDVLLFGQPSRYHVQAMEETIVYCMEYDLLMDLLNGQPKLQHYRQKIFQSALRRSITRVESLVLSTPEERYIDFDQMEQAMERHKGQFTNTNRTDYKRLWNIR